jgi:hypothetical protein
MEESARADAARAGSKSLSGVEVDRLPGSSAHYGSPCAPHAVLLPAAAAAVPAAAAGGASASALGAASLLASAAAPAPGLLILAAARPASARRGRRSSRRRRRGCAAPSATPARRCWAPSHTWENPRVVSTTSDTTDKKGRTTGRSSPTCHSGNNGSRGGCRRWAPAASAFSSAAPGQANARQQGQTRLTFSQPSVHSEWKKWPGGG